MLKYLTAGLVVILGLALFIARQDERATQQRAQKAAQLDKDTISTKTDEQHPQENVSDANRYTPSWYGFFRWPTGSTAWAIILTLMAIAEQTNQTTRAAKATELAVETANKTRELQEDTAKRQLRAYLCISKGRLNFTKEGPLEPQLHIVNGGQTPAYEVRSWIEVAVREHPPFHGTPDLAGFTEQLRAVGIIPPQGEEIMVSRKVPKQVAEQSFLQTRFKILYVYGQITYKDAFGQDRYTKFRLIFGGPAGTRTKVDQDGIEMGYLSMDSGGNEAT